MANVLHNCKAVGKTVFVGSVVALLIVCIAVGSIEYYQINNLQNSNSKLQADYNELQTDYQNLNATYNQLQLDYDSSQRQMGTQASTIVQLQSQVTSLTQQAESLNQQLTTSQNTVQSQSTTINSQTSQITNLQSQIAGLNSNIASLQLQLSNATTLIAQLQGPTGILPTYMDLHYVGPTGSPSYYFLQLSLKNTGTVPITQIFVTLNSVQIPMTFTYLNSTISVNTPLPSYQTTNGGQNVTPPINNIGTYPLIIQALATNSTIYTYQTTITAHV